MLPSELEDLRQLQGTIGRLQDKLDLDRLPVAKSAAFDSHE